MYAADTGLCCYLTGITTGKMAWIIWSLPCLIKTVIYRLPTHADILLLAAPDV
jgi:hypothetical protein